MNDKSNDPTTAESAPGWVRTHPNPLATTFAPGTRVRHLNPRFADWRGTVTPEDGTARFMRCHDLQAWGEGNRVSTEVHIRWEDTAGAFEGLAWYDVDAIAPLNEQQHASQPIEQPHFKPGDKVRITIDASVSAASATHVALVIRDATDHVTGDVEYVAEAVIPHLAEGVTVELLRSDDGPAPGSLPTPPLASRVEMLGLSPRVNNCLVWSGHLNTIGDLVALTEQELRDIRNFGDRALAEVHTALAACGLALKASGS